MQSYEISKWKIHLLVAIFPCPYSLAILLLTREWGQGNEKLGSEWVLVAASAIVLANIAFLVAPASGTDDRTDEARPTAATSIRRVCSVHD